jgi:hypothetical protein
MPDDSAEVHSVIDVHPPHASAHSWRDILIHLFTITLGLIIALSLEGLVEWQHHRHLVHDAEASLHDEIQSNASGMADTVATLHQNQADLKHAVDMLNILIATKKLPNGGMTIGYRIVTFDNVSWKTAQTTGALSYMPYSLAKEYANIYGTQEELTAAEQQAARDAVLNLGVFINLKHNDPDPTPEQAEAMKLRIETLQGQLLLVDNYMKSLDRQYKQFLAAHP